MNFCIHFHSSSDSSTDSEEDTKATGQENASERMEEFSQVSRYEVKQLHFFHDELVCSIDAGDSAE